MTKFDNTWNVSGAMVDMGNLACKYAKRYNESVLHFNTDECLTAENNKGKLCLIALCVRCFDGFDLKWKRNEQSLIYNLWIEYQGEMIGMPWKPLEGVIK